MWIDISEVVCVGVALVADGQVKAHTHAGLQPDKADMPMIPGREASGVIEAVGEGVSGLKIGDRVVYLHTGAFAEKTVVPDSSYHHSSPCILSTCLTSLH